VRNYPSCKKILREVKKVIKISLVHTNGKKECSTKPHVHNLIHEFLINMAFTMACPNFKKGLKMVSGPLGVKLVLLFPEELVLEKCFPIRGRNVEHHR
jgi:hypothetical protein